MKPYLESTIAFYNRNMEDYMRNTVALQDIVWLERFAQLLPKNGAILDVGCGYGRDTKTLGEFGYQMTGIDLSDKMIEKAREYDPHGNFLTMDMTDLNFPNASFDGIWCSAALLHLSKKDAMTTLGKMFRVLKKEGVLYLLLKEGAGETLTTDSRYGDAQKYYAYYQKEEIVKMLSENGFDVHRIEEHGQEDAYRKQTKILFIIGIKQ